MEPPKRRKRIKNKINWHYIVDDAITFVFTFATVMFFQYQNSSNVDIGEFFTAIGTSSGVTTAKELKARWMPYQKDEE